MGNGFVEKAGVVLAEHEGIEEHLDPSFDNGDLFAAYCVKECGASVLTSGKGGVSELF